MSKKGALGLSMEVLVIIIISLVVLAGGIKLLYGFIDTSVEIKDTLDRQTAEELERLLTDQGKRVALAFPSVTLERGNNHVFGLGLLNVGPEQEFRIQIEPTAAKSNTGEDLSLEGVKSWLLYDTESFKLQENEHHLDTILVSVPVTAIPGDYYFHIRVFTAAAEQYGNTQTMYVTVE